MIFQVRHAMTAHLGPTTVYFEKISEEDAKEVKALEAKEAKGMGFEAMVRNLTCAMCRGGSKEPGPLSRSEMDVHLKA